MWHGSHARKNGCMLPGCPYTASHQRLCRSAPTPPSYRRAGRKTSRRSRVMQTPAFKRQLFRDDTPAHRLRIVRSVRRCAARRRARKFGLRPAAPDRYLIARPVQTLPPSHQRMSVSVSVQYAARVAAGKVERDSAQAAVVAKLALLEKRLAEHGLARKSSSLGWLFGARAQEAGPIKGLYIFGAVGRGKTMLMDLFFAASPVVRKRRVHFHEFMTDVHERIYALRQKAKLGQTNGEDPIVLAAAAIADETRLLCFDEFHVTDIADAMILGRLFKRLFELGVVVVATSNVPPAELYKDGLNRALFLPFIALIEEHMDIGELRARTDFRLEKLAGAPVWYVPADRAADAALDEAWRRLTAGHAGEELDLTVKGRIVRVPRATMGVARFSFHDLCQQPLAAADYLKIPHEFPPNVH